MTDENFLEGYASNQFRRLTPISLYVKNLKLAGKGKPSCLETSRFFGKPQGISDSVLKKA
jgi:hypothetical protein